MLIVTLEHFTAGWAFEFHLVGHHSPVLALTNPRIRDDISDITQTCFRTDSRVFILAFNTLTRFLWVTNFIVAFIPSSIPRYKNGRLSALSLPFLTERSFPGPQWDSFTREAASSNVQA